MYKKSTAKVQILSVSRTNASHNSNYTSPEHLGLKKKIKNDLTIYLISTLKRKIKQHLITHCMKLPLTIGSLSTIKITQSISIFKHIKINTYENNIPLSLDFLII